MLKLTVNAISKRSFTKVPFKTINTSNKQFAGQLERVQSYKELREFYDKNKKLIDNDYCFNILACKISALSWLNKPNYNEIDELSYFLGRKVRRVTWLDDRIRFISNLAKEGEKRDNVWSYMARELKRHRSKINEKQLENYAYSLSFMRQEESLNKSYQDVIKALRSEIEGNVLNDSQKIEDEMILILLSSKNIDLLDLHDQFEELIENKIEEKPELLKPYLLLLSKRQDDSGNVYVKETLWNRINKILQRDLNKGFKVDMVSLLDYKFVTNDQY